jgi:hypothetical protein
VQARTPARRRPQRPPVRAPVLGQPSAPGRGSPIPTEVARPISSSFGVDLSPVRVHQGGSAATAASALRARAVAYGSDILLGAGERATDLGVMAHEVAHVVQQRGAARVQRLTQAGGDRFEHEARRAAAAVLRRERFQVRERTPPTVQRLGISDALDYFADKANLIPGFRMFTIVLGVNPVNMSRVDRSGANIMRALIEFIPGGGLIVQALDNHGVFERVAGWVEQQISGLGHDRPRHQDAIDPVPRLAGAGATSSTSAACGSARSGSSPSRSAASSTSRAAW